MATAEASLLGFLGTTAEFRSWGKGVSDMLAAAGLTRASDSAQVDWASVARPGVVNTAAGFEMWRFSDALQASAPVFVKIEYGVGGAVDRPSLWVTVGTGSNGAGTLTGQVGARTQVAPTASGASGALRPWYVSAGPDRLVVGGNLTGASSPGMTFGVERTRDGAGAATADGIFTFLLSGAATAIQTVPFTGTVPGTTSNTPWPSLTPAHVSNAGGNIALTPAVTAVGRMLFGINALAYATGDIGGGTPVTVSILGQTRTYLPLSGFHPGGNLLGLNLAATNNSNLALLWE